MNQATQAWFGLKFCKGNSNCSDWHQLPQQHFSPTETRMRAVTVLLLWLSSRLLSVSCGNVTSSLLQTSFALIPTVAPPTAAPTPSLTPNPRTDILYIGTSSPGMLAFDVAADGQLKPHPINVTLPHLCMPTLTRSSASLFALFSLCEASPSVPQVWRFGLGTTGNITNAVGPLPLNGDQGSLVQLATSPASVFGYASTFLQMPAPGSQFRENVDVVSIDSNSGPNVEAGLGLSLIVPGPADSGCSENHDPDEIISAPDGLLLSVANFMVCRGADGAELDFTVFSLDSRTGAIGNPAGIFGFTFPIEGQTFHTYRGALVLLGEQNVNNDPASANLRLFRLSTAGVDLQTRCNASDHPSCANPDNGAIHPSGKFAFVVDQTAGGIWTIPINGTSLQPQTATLTPVPLFAQRFSKLAFAAGGSFLYLAQWQIACADCVPPVPAVSAQILGFIVDSNGGTLTPILGGPTNLDQVTAVSSMLDVAPE
jgi:hypothetical protein